MLTEQSLTIVFRGLMVSHLVSQQNAQSQFLEIGVLPSTGHSLRIHIMDEASEDPVQIIPLDDIVKSTSRRWHLEVIEPIKEGVSLYTNGAADFDRMTHPDEKDYRWIIDLEGKDFYQDGLDGSINTAKFDPILRIPHGTFYTNEKSQQLKRKEGRDEFKNFGSVAADIGCDIQLKGEEVLLLDEDGREIFRFKKEPGTFYEFVNTPPDHSHHGHELPFADHFQLYYEILPANLERFVFEENSQGSKPPGPRPQLCGKVFMSQMTEPFN